MTMRAVRVHEPGGAEQLRYENVPLPEPGAGEVRVRVAAAGVNFRDIYQRGGVVPVEMPCTLGLEAAGTVELIGPPDSAGADHTVDFAPGDRVACAMGLGAYAEAVCLPAARVVPVPDGIELPIAAAVLLQGLTAHYLSHDTFPLQPGQRCLVHSGAGGVGLLLIQLAKLRGAEVLTTVSTADKAALAAEAGADHTILYTREDFAARVRELTGGEGVQVVYDAVGADTFQKSLDALARRGMLVLYGQSSGLVPPFDLYQLADRGSLFVTRPHLMHHIYNRTELLARAGAVFDLVASDRLKVRIGANYPLHEAARAHADLEGRKTTGKLLLIP